MQQLHVSDRTLLEQTTTRPIRLGDVTVGGGSGHAALCWFPGKRIAAPAAQRRQTLIMAVTIGSTSVQTVMQSNSSVLSVPDIR